MRTLFLLTLLIANPANALVIDAFDSGEPFTLENTDQGVTLIQTADVLGGSREVATLDLVEFDPAKGMKLTVTPIRSNGHVAIVYDHSELDLTLDGADRFRVTLDPGLGFGPNPPFMEVIIFVNGSYPQTHVHGVFGAAGTPEDGVFEILFEDEQVGNAISVEAVREITLVIKTNGSFTEGESLTLTDFSTVPEPSTASLLVLGLTGLAVRRRWMQ